MFVYKFIIIARINSLYAFFKRDDVFAYKTHINGLMINDIHERPYKFTNKSFNLSFYKATFNKRTYNIYKRVVRSFVKALQNAVFIINCL